MRRDDMETIVVYKSNTGFTKQYAEWIAEDLKCKAVQLKDVNEQMLKEYDRVVFGGYIMGNMIMGLNKIEQMNPSNLCVFSVGSTSGYKELEDIIKETNHIGEKPFYYFEGGFRFNQLKLPVRMMLKMLKKSAAKKENKTRQEEEMAAKIGTNFDHSNREFIKKMIDDLAC